MRNKIDVHVLINTFLSNLQGSPISCPQIMEQNPSQIKWEGKVSTTTKAKPNQIWTLFQDFFNLHKWFPSLSTCYGIHGANGEPGCIRYCAGFSIPSHKDHASSSVSWSKEKLIKVDHKNQSLSYEMVDNNIGFKSYVSTIKISHACGDGGGEEEEGCLIEWWFVVEPVEGWKLEDLVSKYEVGLELMASKMEDACLN